MLLLSFQDDRNYYHMQHHPLLSLLLLRNKVKNLCNTSITKNITHTHRWQSPVSLLCVCIILILWLVRAAIVAVVVIERSCRYSKCFAYLLLGRWCADSSHSTTPLTSVSLITCEASRTRNEK